MNQSKEGAEDYCKLSASMQQHYFDMLVSTIDIQPGWSILDLGCGTGNGTIKLAKAVGPTGWVVGIDPIQERIEKARIQYSSPNIEYRTGYGHEVSAMPGEHRFDLVVAGTVMHWISPELKSETFKSVHAILKPGGVFLFNCMKKVDSANTLELLDHVTDPSIKAKFFESFFCPSKETFHRLASESGFVKSSIEEVSVDLPYGTVERAVKSVASSLHVIDFDTLVAELTRIVNDPNIDTRFLFDEHGEPRFRNDYYFVNCIK